MKKYILAGLVLALLASCSSSRQGMVSCDYISKKMSGYDYNSKKSAGYRYK